MTGHFSKKAGEPIFIKIDLNDNLALLEEIYSIVQRRSGNRPLSLIIQSKLEDAVMQTPFFVNDEIFKDFSNHQLVEVSDAS